MDLQLPAWVIDVERERRSVMFGRIPLELVISQGNVAKVIGTRTKQTKFRDNNEAQIYVLDLMRTKALESDGTTTFSVVHKNGKISQINEFEQIEINYPL